MEEGVARGTHAAVGAGKEARLKDAAALLDRLLHVDGPEQPIVQHIKRHLHRTTARMVGRRLDGWARANMWVRRRAGAV